MLAITGLDPTFGTAGIALSDIYASSRGQSVPQAARASAQQPDGKVIVVGVGGSGQNGGMFLVRFNANGTIDQTFGTAGVAIAPFSASAGAHAVAVAPNGQIVVGGNVSPLGNQYSSDFAVARFNANGTLDATFGNGGTTTTSVTNQVLLLQGIAVQPNGQIVAVGAEANSTILGAAGASPEFALARYNTNGSPDTSFGTGGIVTTPFAGSGGTEPTALAIQSNGSIVATGLGFFGKYGGIVAARYTTSGAPDLSFNGNGTCFVPTFDSTAGFNNGAANFLGTVGGAVAIQANGEIVLTAGVGAISFFSQTGTQIVPIGSVAKFNTNGTLDTTFGAGGLATIASGGYNINAAALAIQANGQILAGGLASQGFGSVYGLFRLNPNGSPDTAFGVGGLITTSAGNTSYPGPGVMGIYPLSTGQVLLSIHQIVDTTVDLGIGLARYGTPAVTPPYEPPGDLDGLGKTDIAVYLPLIGAFAIRPSNGAPDEIIPFGFPGVGNSIPAIGDYDGSGQDELAVYLPSLGDFAYRPARGGPDKIIPFGFAGAGNTIPVPADYDGSGHTELGVYLPSIGAFAYRPANGGADVVIPFGFPGSGNSIPVPGDYDGSGHTELAVYLPSIGAFAYRPFNGSPDKVIPFGFPGVGNSIPVPGDYDGSGHTELAVYLPSIGAFAYRPAKGGADVVTYFGAPGPGLDIPVPGDYDGAGHTELAVYLPTIGAFAYRPAKGAPTSSSTSAHAASASTSR